MEKIKCKVFMLALFMILITSCSAKGNTATQDKPSVEDKQQFEEIEDEENSVQTVVDVEDSSDPLKSIDLSLEPNELGEIMILMYHGIGDEESAWQRTADNFRKDLEKMYSDGYRMVSLNDYAKGKIDTEQGFTPIILTFDDGRRNNFNIIEVDGKMEIDPDCAVGILEEYKKKYPDFGVTASFFLGTNIFGQEEYQDYKLKFLVENGYDVGNHTYSHEEMKFLNGDEIQSEIGSVNNLINDIIPDYVVETLALPHGTNPKEDYRTNMLEGTYEGRGYKNIAVLNVGWRPDYSPFDKLTDFTRLYRVTASEINVDGCGIYDYFKQFSENRRERFISDGDENVVTIPKRHEEYLNMDMVGDRLVNIYE
jgi:hypothetical protein